jgi:hypothetical protein
MELHVSCRSAVNEFSYETVAFKVSGCSKENAGQRPASAHAAESYQPGRLGARDSAQSMPYTDEPPCVLYKAAAALLYRGLV